MAAQGERLDRSLRLLWGLHLKPSSRYPVSPLFSPALNHTPDILISGTLVSGHPGNLTCSVPWACERGTPPIFSWKGATVSSHVLTTALSSVLTLTPRPQDHGTTLTCQVTLPGAEVTTTRVVRLNVSCECWARMPGSLMESGGQRGRGHQGLRHQILESRLGGVQEDARPPPHPFPISAAPGDTGPMSTKASPLTWIRHVSLSQTHHRT